jgi:hypothetical protein
VSPKPSSPITKALARSPEVSLLGTSMRLPGVAGPSWSGFGSWPAPASRCS